MNIGLDMDELIFPLLSEEEKKYVCTTPWTEEIGQKMDELVRERVKIKKGYPVFGTVLLDCALDSFFISSSLFAIHPTGDILIPDPFPQELYGL